MMLAHKVALDPNDAQETYFRRAAGTARFAYPWALAEWQRQYEAWNAESTGPKPSNPSLRCVSSSTRSKRGRIPGSWRGPRTPPKGR